MSKIESIIITIMIVTIAVTITAVLSEETTNFSNYDTLMIEVAFGIIITLVVLLITRRSEKNVQDMSIKIMADREERFQFTVKKTLDYLDQISFYLEGIKLWSDNLTTKIYSNLPSGTSDAKFQGKEHSRSLIAVINLQVGLSPNLAHRIYELATSSKELCETDWILFNNQFYDLGKRIKDWTDIKDKILKDLQPLKKET